MNQGVRPEGLRPLFGFELKLVSGVRLPNGGVFFFFLQQSRPFRTVSVVRLEKVKVRKNLGICHCSIGAQKK